MPTFPSDQLAEGARRTPIDDHGKLRFAYFSVAPLTVAYAAGDQIDLCRLPSGRKRIILPESRFRTSAFGAARTLSIGHRAYLTRPAGETGAIDPELGTAFVNAVSVATALTPTPFSTTALKYDIYSLDEVTIFATIAGGTMPVGATLDGLIAYVYE